MNALPAGLAPLRARHRVRLWIPMILLLALLSPLLIPALVIFALMLAVLRVNPATTVFSISSFALALRGTRIEIEAPGASIVVTIV